MLSRMFNSVCNTLKDPATQMTLLRLYNVAAAMLVINDWRSNPEASASEYSFDVLVHLAQACVTLASTQEKKIAMMGANAYRLFSIAKNTLSGTSSIPLVANGVDVINHGLNIFMTNRAK